VFIDVNTKVGYALEHKYKVQMIRLEYFWHLINDSQEEIHFNSSRIIQKLLYSAEKNKKKTSGDWDRIFLLERKGLVFQPTGSTRQYNEGASHIWNLRMMTGHLLKLRTRTGH
jgi:hypothetical protein